MNLTRQANSGLAAPLKPLYQCHQTPSQVQLANDANDCAKLQEKREALAAGMGERCIRAYVVGV